MINKKSLAKTAGAISLFVASATPILAGVGDGKTLTISKSGEGGVSSISTLLSAVFNIAVVVAIIFVFLMLIMGGYGWITAGGDKAKVEEARTRITNALIGLAIVAAAWALIVIVGQFFGVSLNSITIPSAAESSDNL